MEKKKRKEPGAHCSCMHQDPLVTCILLCYAKVMANSCLKITKQDAMNHAWAV